MALNRITGLTAALLLATSSLAIAQTTADPGAPTDQQTTGTQALVGEAMGDEYLDQSEIEDRLEDRDFSDISVEFADGQYTGTATWWGEEVDLRVDARTGRVLEPNRMTESQIQNKLEDEGYENVSEVREAGSEYTARAERFGEETEVRVSARSGNVLDPRELTTDQIVEALEEDDYSNIKIFEREEDYGNHRAVAEKDDDTFLLEIHPISGDVVEERAETEQDHS